MIGATPRLSVDLRAKPDERWQLSESESGRALNLVRCYVADLGVIDSLGPMIKAYTLAHADRGFRLEVGRIAATLGVSFEEALLARICYDAVKVSLGCTAFAVDTPAGPFHARNLDWWTREGMLVKFTSLIDFSGRDGSHSFTVVGWPDFIGALSGVAPGRFAVNFNAVLSSESPAMAKPISLYLRTVLEQADEFGQAVFMLSEGKVFSDCLLRVSGVKQGEMAVIERTPTRSGVRRPERGSSQ